jgi:benzoate membrane transport protein
MVDRVMSLLPMPVVMAMPAGVFLGFGNDLVAVESDAMIAGPIVLVFLLATAFPPLARFVPPIIGALVVGCWSSQRPVRWMTRPSQDPGWRPPAFLCRDPLAPSWAGRFGHAQH